MFCEKLEKLFNGFKRQEDRLERHLMEPSMHHLCTKQNSLRIMVINILYWWWVFGEKIKLIVTGYMKGGG